MKARWPWAIAGIVLGATVGLWRFAPAAWVAQAVASASAGQVQLGDARGTVWRGSAVLMLSGGAGSQNAAALPGRLLWRLHWRGGEFELRAWQACCLVDELRVRIVPGFRRTTLHLQPTTSMVSGSTGTAAAPAAPLTPIAHWPAQWLTGLGAPWNTLQLGGVVRLASPGLTVESAQGRLSFSGHAELQLEGLSSRLSTLDTLGDYRLTIDGQPQAGGSALLTLSTLKGPLLLTGSGQWGQGGPAATPAGAGLHFRGEARADAGAEGALNNLLNVIGRRQGAISLLSIG